MRDALRGAASRARRSSQAGGWIGPVTCRRCAGRTASPRRQLRAARRTPRPGAGAARRRSAHWGWAAATPEPGRAAGPVRRPAHRAPRSPAGTPSPRQATYRGAHRAASCSRTGSPARSSGSLSSSARAVERATRLVMPSPAAMISVVSDGCRRRGVQPLAASVGHSRLLGFAKCRPTAPDHSEGLMPQSSTARPGATRSGTTLPYAACSLSGEGRGSGTRPTLHGARQSRLAGLRRGDGAL